MSNGPWWAFVFLGAVAIWWFLIAMFGWWPLWIWLLGVVVVAGVA